MKIGKALARAIGIPGAVLLGLLILLSILARTPGPQGRWAYNVLLGVDLFVNAVAMGDPRETISSRLGKWQGGDNQPARGFAKAICPAISVLMAEEDHCRKSVDREHGPKAVLP